MSSADQIIHFVFCFCFHFRLCWIGESGNDMLPQQFASDSIHDTRIQECFVPVSTVCNTFVVERTTALYQIVAAGKPPIWPSPPCLPDFLSPPVQFARWAPMRRFLSVCPSVFVKNSDWIIIHISTSNVVSNL